MALFVGDLASVCTEADLIEVFSQFGTVEEAKLIRDTVTKRSLMYGFVTMETSSQSEKAINELDGEFLFGRRMKVRWGMFKKKGEAPSVDEKLKSLPVHVTFTSQRAATFVTEQLLWDLFSCVGEVIDVTIHKNEQDQSGHNLKGFGFVHFPATDKGIESARLAVERHHNCILESIFFTCSYSYKLQRLMADLPAGQDGIAASVSDISVVSEAGYGQSVCGHSGRAHSESGASAGCTRHAGYAASVSDECESLAGGRAASHAGSRASHASHASHASRAQSVGSHASNASGDESRRSKKLSRGKSDRSLGSQSTGSEGRERKGRSSNIPLPAFTVVPAPPYQYQYAQQYCPQMQYGPVYPQQQYGTQQQYSPQYGPQYAQYDPAYQYQYASSPDSGMMVRQGQEGVVMGAGGVMYAAGGMPQGGMMPQMSNWQTVMVPVPMGVAGVGVGGMVQGMGAMGVQVQGMGGMQGVGVGGIGGVQTVYADGCEYYQPMVPISGSMSMHSTTSSQSSHSHTIPHSPPMTTCRCLALCLPIL